MALTANVIFQKTGGSDSAGGSFDPSQTSGMYTDLAALNALTSTPTVNSASYVCNVVDIGSWMFVGAGTNWYKGWAKIASLGAWSATITAAGSGYSVGDILTVVGGAGTAATFKVATLSGSGVATLTATSTYFAPGAYSAIPSNAASTTDSGAGTGCTLTITWGFNLQCGITTWTVTTLNGAFTLTIGQMQSYAAAPAAGGYNSWALNGQFYTNTTAGIASVAGPTSGTWAIDRSRNSSIFWSGTNATNAANTVFVYGAGGLPTNYVPGKQDVGNIIQTLTDATGTLIASLFTITAWVSGTSSYTLDRAASTVSATGITWSLGGSFATVGGMGAMLTLTSVHNNTIGQRAYLSGSESFASSTYNVATGPLQTSGSLWIEGFRNTPGDMAPSAYVSAGTATSTYVINFNAQAGSDPVQNLVNVVLDANTKTSVGGVQGVGVATGVAICWRVFVVNAIGATASPAFGTSLAANQCYAYNCTTGYDSALTHFGSVADACTTGFTLPASGANGATSSGRCVATGCTTGFTNGAGNANAGLRVFDVAYNCSGSGFAQPTAAVCNLQHVACISWGNGAYGYNDEGSTIYSNYLNCAAGSNTTANFSQVPAPIFGFVNLTSNPFSGNIGGGTDLAVNSSNNTYVKPTSSLTPGAGDVGLNLYIMAATGFTPGIYPIVGFDTASGSWILQFSPAATSATGGGYRMADFRPNNVAGGGALLRGMGIGVGAQGLTDAIDIGAVQHPAPVPAGQIVGARSIGTY